MFVTSLKALSKSIDRSRWGFNALLITNAMSKKYLMEHNVLCFIH